MQAPLAPWIRWPGYLAWVFLATLPLAVLTVRSGQWQQGLLLYALCCLLSLLLLGYFGLLSLLPRLADRRRALLLRSLPAIPGAVLLILAMQSRDVPPIHDISTDLDNPPRFERVLELRDAGDNSLELDEEVMAQQREAYPDLDTLRSAQPFAAVYAAARDTARELGWEIVREDPNAGYIEAVAHTAIMNFEDDIAVRVSTDADGVLVDLRSASRVGVSDLGANAKRIRTFLDTLDSKLGQG